METPCINKVILSSLISCLRFLPNHNIFYDISLSHKQKQEFGLVSIGRKVPQARSVRGSVLAVIRLMHQSIPTVPSATHGEKLTE